MTTQSYFQHQKSNVCSDPVLCQGKMYPNPPANDGWNRKIEWLKSTPQHRELDRIDAELMAFESTIFPGFTTLRILTEIQRMMDEINCEPDKGRIIFMLMYNEIVWRNQDNKNVCFAKFHPCDRLCEKKFPHRHWSFLGPGSEKKWFGTDTYKPNGKWMKSLNL